MKKSTCSAKLMLKLETVKALNLDKLTNVIGGVNQPTTTVLSPSKQVC